MSLHSHIRFLGGDPPILDIAASFIVENNLGCVYYAPTSNNSFFEPRISEFLLSDNHRIEHN